MNSFIKDFAKKRGWIILITLLFNFGAIKFIYQYANSGTFIGYQGMAYGGEYAIYIIVLMSICALFSDYFLVKSYFKFKNNQSISNE